MGSRAGDGSRTLTVSACRSSEQNAAYLHVDAGVIALHIEQNERGVWRLDLAPGRAERLMTEPGACWNWHYDWDGVADDGKPLPSGSYSAYGRSLSKELRHRPAERRDFTNSP
ncbi:MAG TPA: hypothetical protein VNA30_03970 [Mycobacteriales bacterium]|nr:hypothetical protein [Mycobacteriales bacterium]